MHRINFSSETPKTSQGGGIVWRAAERFPKCSLFKPKINTVLCQSAPKGSCWTVVYGYVITQHVQVYTDMPDIFTNTTLSFARSWAHNWFQLAELMQESIIQGSLRFSSIFPNRCPITNRKPRAPSLYLLVLWSGAPFPLKLIHNNRHERLAHKADQQRKLIQTAGNRQYRSSESQVREKQKPFVRMIQTKQRYLWFWGYHRSTQKVCPTHGDPNFSKLKVTSSNFLKG